MVATKTELNMKTQSSKPFPIHPSIAASLILVALLLTASHLRAGVANITFTFQQGNEQTNGVNFGSGPSYTGVVDGSITDGSGTFARTTNATSTLGNQFRSGSPNGQQWVSLFSYNLAELNNYIAANTGPYSSVIIQSVSFQIVSAGANSGGAMALGLYGTDPFTSSGCTWSNYTTATPWTVPYQNLTAPNNTVAYGYTGGGSALTASLGGSNPGTGVTTGNPLIWGSSINFISAVTNALARTDSTLYLTARGSFFNNGDNRLSVNYSPATTVANRPLLTINVIVNTTSPSATWMGGSDTSWANAANWSPTGVPGADAPIIFDTPSTTNLNTVMNQDFTVASVNVTNPASAVSIGGNNHLTIDSGGIDLSAATQDLSISAPVILGVNQTWNVAGSRTLTVNGGVSGSAAVTVSGPGEVSLGAAATYTGDTTVSAGSTLQMGAANVLPNGSGFGNLIVSGTVNLNGNSQSINGLAGNGLVDNKAAGIVTLTVGNTNISFGGTITNSGGALTLIKTGSGGQTLSGTNFYSGGTIINGGSINPLNGNAIGTGSLTVNAGTFYPVATLTLTNPVTLNGGNLQVGGAGSHLATYTGPVTVGGNTTLYTDGGTAGMTLSGGVSMGSGGYTLSAQGSQTTTISGPISGTSGTVEVGSGTLTLSATNTFGGTLRATNGTLSFANAYAATNATLDYNAADSGTINYNGLNCIIGALTGSRNFAFSSTLSIGNNNLSTNYTGVMSGSGSVNKIGTGTWTLTGANTYTGNTTVSAGTLAVSGSGSVASTNIIVAGGATFDVSALSPTPVFTLSAYQTLANSGATTATLNGGVNASSGKVTLTYAAGTPALQITSGTLTLGNLTTFTVNNTGAILQPGTNVLVQANGGTVAALTLPSVVVVGNGAAGPASLFIDGSGNLDLIIAPTSPTLTSVSPNPVPGSSYPVTLTLTGSGFTGATAVLLTNVTAVSGASYTPTVNSDTSLTVSFVPGTLASTWNATVVNGTPSAPVGFTVSVPATVSINPAALESAGPGNLVLSGSGGVAGDSYAVMSTANLNPPVVWTPVVTNTFDGSGNFSYTNTVSSGTPKLFLRIAQ